MSHNDGHSRLEPIYCDLSPGLEQIHMKEFGPLLLFPLLRLILSYRVWSCTPPLPLTSTPDSPSLMALHPTPCTSALSAWTQPQSISSSGSACQSSSPTRRPQEIAESLWAHFPGGGINRCTSVCFNFSPLPLDNRNNKHSRSRWLLLSPLAFCLWEKI